MKLKSLGKTTEDIKSVHIHTQETAVCIADKCGSLGKFAGCDHTINCMVVFPLTHAELASPSYTNTSAADSHIDVLPAKSRSS